VIFMPASPDRAPRYLLAGIVGVLIVAGYASTLWLYYPGAKTWDAKYVYQDIAKGFYGDWQSPVMTWLWGLIDPIAPGSASMFLLIATTYWLGFALPSLALAVRGDRWALLPPFLALMPLAFVFVGTYMARCAVFQLLADRRRYRLHRCRTAFTDQNPCAIARACAGRPRSPAAY
jgi:hypothetical protein